MHHDPLCPCADIEWASCFRTSAEDDRCVSCRCYLIVKRIAEERADEREKAARRVAALPHWGDGWPENVVINRQPAIDAVRGER